MIRKKRKSSAYNAQRKSPNYKYVIPTRAELMDFFINHENFYNINQLSYMLKLKAKGEKHGVHARLRAMARDGQLIQNKKGCFGLPKAMHLVTGKVVANPEGFGFLQTESGNDIYLSPAQMRQVLHGDVVKCCCESKNLLKKKNEGSIVEIIERANDLVIGQYYKENKVHYLIPDNQKLYQPIIIENIGQTKIKEGEYALVKITKQPDKNLLATAKIVEIIREKNKLNLAIQLSIKNFELPTEWPTSTDSELQTLLAMKTDEVLSQRKDLRAKHFVTIDGADAKDFDDAVYCEKLNKNWRLYVAIADVAEYVKEGSLLDQEAVQRGTSVYFPNHVIPMLPEEISNNVCSLRPNEDRLCLVCELIINNEGKTVRSRFFEAVINSKARLTYDQAWGIINNKKATQHTTEINNVLQQLYALYQVLALARSRRGALEFESAEASFDFDEDGNVTEITLVERNDSHRLIEEFMIAANVAAAKFIKANRLNAPYRIHDPPKQEKLDNLVTLMRLIGLSDFISPKDQNLANGISKLLKVMNARDDKQLIESLLLKAQSLATYQLENSGHFGLMLNEYTHFTSPIRRYPDLLVHRAIKSVINNQNNNRSDETDRVMSQLVYHCTYTEKRAEEAAREVDSRLKCQYMARRVGETFNGVIYAVKSFGLFIRLSDFNVVGLVHISTIKEDFYHYDGIGFKLCGEMTGNHFRLADEVEVKVVKVSVSNREVDFELADNKAKNMRNK